MLIAVLSVMLSGSCNWRHSQVKDHSRQVDQILENTGKLYPDKKRMIVYIDSAYHAIPDPGAGDMCRKYIYTGKYCYIHPDQDLSTAMLYADSALSVVKGEASDDAYTAYYAQALFFKGDVLMYQKKYNHAFQYFYRVGQAIEKIHDTGLVILYYNRLAEVSFRQSRFLDAGRYYIQVVKEYSRSRNPDIVKCQGLLNNIGVCYVKGGILDSAAYYFNECLRYVDLDTNKSVSSEHGKGVMRAIVYGNLGDVYFKRGAIAEAESLYIKNISYNGREGYEPGDAQITEIKLGTLYLQLGQYGKVKALLEKTRKSINRLYEGDTELKWRKLKKEYSEKTGQTDEAYHYFKTYMELKDSAVAAEDLSKVDVSKEYDTMKRQYELDLLREKNKLKDVYLVIAVIFSVMAVVIVVLVWLYWVRSKRHIVMLTNLNTQIQTQNKEMRRALTSLEQSQQDNTQMMKIVAHDLRNPIGAIASIAKLLLDDDNYTSEQRQMIELIQTSGLNSLEMITDLLHVNTTPEAMKKESVDLQALLRYCVDLLQFKAEQKNQFLMLEAEDVTLNINREKMWRVVSNLIVNAIKFSPEGALIEIQMYRREGAVRIEVKDHGIGIPEDLKEKIFDMFTDAKRSGTSGEQSFGLGLSISKQIVEAHDGKIWFESEAGKGTTFYIELLLQEELEGILTQ